MEKESHDKDPNWLENFRRGDTNELASLLKSRFGQLCAIARTILLDKSLAEDIVMDGFVMLWLQRKQLDSKSNPFQLLSIIVLRRALNYNRSILKITGTEELLKEEEDESPDPEEILLRKTEAEDIDSALEELGPDLAKIFRLYLLGFTRKEIANETGLPAWRVKRELEKARTILRKKLRDDDDIIEEH